MAVDQRRGAEVGVDAGQQSPQRPVVGLVEAFDPPQRVVDGKPLVVDLLGIAHDPRHRAEPARDPHRAGVGEGRQPALEHARIELVGLAVDVDVAAREMRADERLAAADHPGDELVDEGILGAAQGGKIEPGGRQEGARIDPAAVRRIEHEGCGDRLRFEDLERGIELGHDWIAHRPERPFSRARFRFTARRPALSTAERSLPSAGIGSPDIYRSGGLWDDSPVWRSWVKPPMPKILLAEDDNDMRRFLVKALQSAGFEVTDYDNGLSAYRRLREEPFQLLLTDIVMPEMDGIELARRASELDPDMKIMFITGFAAVALNPDSHAPKEAKVLSKPFHLRDLVNEVHKMLAA
jgi:two-component system, cell cycle response regulator CpdR